MTTVPTDNQRAALEQDAARLTEAIVTAIRPAIKDQAMQMLGVMAQRGVQDLVGPLLPLLRMLEGDQLRPILRALEKDRIVQAEPAQEARIANTDLAGASTAAIKEFLATRPDGATGKEVLDYCQKVKGIEKRDTARKGMVRLREGGVITRIGDIWRLNKAKVDKAA